MSGRPWELTPVPVASVCVLAAQEPNAECQRAPGVCARQSLLWWRRCLAEGQKPVAGSWAEPRVNCVFVSWADEFL